MDKWTEVGGAQARETLEKFGRTLVQVGGLQIAIFRQADTLFALENSCPHQGASLLSGKLDGGQVKCPAHGMCFRLSDGRLAGSGTDASAKALAVKVFPVRDREGQLQLQLGAGDASA